jgi:hypothetical protein
VPGRRLWWRRVRPAQLSVDASSTKQTFLRVQVSGVGARSVTSAMLRLQAANVAGASSDSGGRIHPITGCGWDELAMTWNTRPAIDGPVLSSVGAVALSQVVNFDVTGAITGDGTYCFAIDSLSANGADYNAREGAVAQPAVLITTGP